MRPINSRAKVKGVFFLFLSLAKDKNKNVEHNQKHFGNCAALYIYLVRGFKNLHTTGSSRSAFA